MRSLKLLAAMSVLTSNLSSAAAPAECEAAARSIDERLAGAELSQQAVALGSQIKAALIQSCAFLDDATIANMLDGIEQLLPAVSDLPPGSIPGATEHRADRDTQRQAADQRRRERDERRAAERARETAERELISAALLEPSRGRAGFGGPIDRPDPMWGARLMDWDVLGDRTRILYQTRPSREQMRDADAAYHLYVVEMDSNDNVVQHHVLEYEITRELSAALLPGRDELLIQWHRIAPRGEPEVRSTLERWSIPDAIRLSETRAPVFDLGTVPVGSSEENFRLVTDSGDLLFVATVSLGTGPNPPAGIAWMLTSSSGGVRDRGMISSEPTRITARDWFRTSDGGAALVLDILGSDEAGIGSSLQPGVQRIGNTEVKPIVMSERRLYVVGSSAIGANLPAFERHLIWLGLENVDQALMVSGESTAFMDRFEGSLRVRDSTVSQSLGFQDRLAVAGTSEGSALLVRNNHRSDEFPPTRGLWLQEFIEGSPRRDTYLELDAEHLGANFTMLGAASGDGLYIAGPGHLLLLDGSREVRDYAEFRAPTSTIAAITSNGGNLWAFGVLTSGGESRQHVWAERVQF